MISFLRVLPVTQLFLMALAVSVGTAADWQTEWEKAVRAAKSEGQLMLYGNRNFERIFPDFEKKYGIRVVYVTGTGRDLLPRLMSEQRVGKYLADIFAAGPGTGFTILQAGGFDPVKPALMLPEVVDEQKWWQGKHPFVDKEGYIFAFNGYPSVNAIYNTDQVDPKELKSYRDLLNPKWKGKIAVFTIVQAAHKFFYHHPDLGPEFLKRLLGEMEVTPSRDMRQVTDWLAVGRFAMAVLVNSNHADVLKAREQGLPIGIFEPGHFKEGAALITAAGSVALPKRPPHPNAAKVALNWLLSREGQTTFQKNYGTVPWTADSRRIDVPKEQIVSEFRRVDGVNYLDVDRPEYIEDKPIRDLMQRSLSARGK